MKILIAEDSPTQADRLKNILEQNGHQVSTAVNGQDALHKLNSFNPNLIISDIMMPEMDGYALCRRIRQNSQLKDLPIILLTTLSQTENIVEGLECGANYIITKPYDDDYLLEHLHTAIDMQKIRQVNEETKDVKIMVNGREHTITAEKSQILDLLISIYDAAVQKNKELYSARLQLQELNNILERKVEERTASLRIEYEEHKRFEKQFLEAQKLESIGQLAGGIAHDFNNLLMIIQCNLEMIKRDLNNDEKNIMRVNDASSAIKRGAELIKRLMAFSRRQQLLAVLVNVQDLIMNVVKLIKPMLGEAIEIKTNFSEHLWSVFLDPGQLENALVNLAVNARDAMKGKGILTITVSNISLNESLSIKDFNINPGDYVEISMSDNGEGISPEILDRVLEPFFTTKEIGKGTGLGLSMVYGFIKQSNGDVTIKSDVGHGTTVNLYLPKASETQTNESIPIEISEINLKGTETILLVEDELDLRLITAEYLTNLGYRVLQAENGKIAWEMLQKEKGIRLLLSDVIMPGEISGLELVELAQTKDPKLKVLFVSGYPKNVLLNEKKSKDLDQPLLMKPYSMLNLARMLRRVLGSDTSKK